LELSDGLFFNLLNTFFSLFFHTFKNFMQVFNCGIVEKFRDIDSLHQKNETQSQRRETKKENEMISTNYNSLQKCYPF
jgi:hypothetical protein